MAWTKDQELAINEYGKNIIVSAGAGSGKTAVLSERVLKHVIDGIDIEDMLILTFTNAAAAEMKERIRKKLINNNLIDQANKIDLAYITTFDAYALSLLKKYSYTLNISKDINIIDNSIITLKKKEILNEIFEEYYNLKNESFLELINSFCLKDDNEIFNAILSLNQQLDNKYDKIDYLNNYISNYYKEENIDFLIDKYMNIIFEKITNIKNQLNNINNFVDEKFYLKINECLLPLINAKNYLDIRYNAYNISLPRLSKCEDEAKLIKDEIKSNIDFIKELTNYNDLDELKNTIYCTKNNVAIIIELLIKLDNKVNEYKTLNNSYEFVDIAKMAINILKENTIIADDLKNKYKEILIDEYQDTNDLQDMFISLIENNNVYMVGDIKQSIYRFRNANPMLFKEKYDNYSNSDIDLKIDLKENFRSRNNVIDGINIIFNLIMDNNIGGASYFDEHQMVFGQKKYLNVNRENYNMEFLNYQLPDDKKYSKTEIEIFTIAKDIKEKIDNHYQIMDKDSFDSRDITYSDFAILIDRSKHFNLYKKVFEYFNIPVNIYKNQVISDSVDIKILKNIYSLIIHIYNKNYDCEFRYSFVSIARSYLFEIDDNEILSYLCNNNFYENDIYKKCKYISDNLESLNNLEIYELILDEFSIYDNLCKIGSVNDHIIILDSIYKIIRSLNDYGYTAQEFYEYLINIFDEGLDISLSLNKENSNSVKIMTIHTSKGLEFPICYFPSLDEKFNISDLKNKFYFSNDYGIIMPYINENAINTLFTKELLKKKYYEDEISEKLRLFYVALTRAREKMIFVTSLDENVLAYKDDEVIDNNTRLSYRSFSDILNSIYKYIKDYIIEVNINDIRLTKDYNLSKYVSYKDNFKGGNIINVNDNEVEKRCINKEKFSKNKHLLYLNNEKYNIKKGLEIHKVFEMVDFNNIDNNIKEEYKNLIDNFLETKLLDNAIKVYKEYEFIDIINDKKMHGIIDLLIEYRDHYKIIDYKLKNTEDDAYLKQLNGYKEYVERITNKSVEIYLYSLINGELTKIK